MNLRLYRAFTMAEALAAVKRDLGPDASIVHTRTFRRGGFLGIGRRTVVEVTATAENRRPSRREPPRKNPRSAEAQRAYGGRRSPGAAEPKQELGARTLDANRLDLLAAIEQHRRDPQSTDGTPGGKADGSESDNRDAASRAPRSTSPHPARANAETPPRPAAPSQQKMLFPHAEHGLPATAGRPNAAVASSPEPGRGIEEGAAGPVSPVARRFILKSTAPESGSGRSRSKDPAPVATAAEQQPAAVAVNSTPPHVGGESALPDLGRAMQEEMFAIRSMVSKVLEQQQQQHQDWNGGSFDRGRQMPKALFDFYLRLVGQELSDELAEQIVSRVEGELNPDELADPEALRQAVLRHVEELIPVADTPIPPSKPDGRPLTVALIGPTGVGKTTTLAKLAATFKLHHGRSVGLVTSDTYRIAAVEQLRTYANIIGLPLKVVLTPSEMRQACHQLRECDVILIDTAGRSQRDRGKLEELQQFIDAADPHEVHLVLSSTASERVLVQEAEAFSQVRCDKIILTKLDEAVSFGVLVNVIRNIGKSLSFVTTGQEVPDHIEPGRPDRIAELVLGGEL